MTDRYTFEPCTCGNPGCDNYIIIDNYDEDKPVRVALNLSRPQAARATDVLNKYAHTNLPDGRNINGEA